MLCTNMGPVHEQEFSFNFKYTMKAPSIAHLSLLTSVGDNRKETYLKNCAHAPNKAIIILYLLIVQNGKNFPIYSAVAQW